MGKCFTQWRENLWIQMKTLIIPATEGGTQHHNLGKYVLTAMLMLTDLYYKLHLRHETNTRQVCETSWTQVKTEVNRSCPRVLFTQRRSDGSGFCSDFLLEASNDTSAKSAIDLNSVLSAVQDWDSSTGFHFQIKTIEPTFPQNTGMVDMWQFTDLTT